MITEVFDCHSPAVVFLRFPPADRQVALPPVASLQRVRRDSSLPLPLFLRRFGPLNKLLQFLWVWAYVFRAFFFVAASTRCCIVQSIQHPSSSHDQLPCHIAVPLCPVSLVFLLSMAWIGSSHTPSFGSSHSCFGCPFHPLDRSRLVPEAVRGALLTKGPDSSFAEAHRGFNSEPINIEDEVKDQEDEVEDGRDK